MRAKKPTALSTTALAAFLTWKQFDLLLLLAQMETPTTRSVADSVSAIYRYDRGHGGVRYDHPNWSGVYSSLRTLERRDLVARAWEGSKLHWSLRPRGRKLLELLEATL